jgi:hypothetical protein
MISFLALLLNILVALELRKDPRIHLTFDHEPIILDMFYETFPPIDDVVVQHFHFTTSTPLIVNLHDAFCTGNSFLVFDNFRIIFNEESILNFCGISADNLQPIISPDFREVEFFMDPGEHQLVVVVFHSPIGSQKTSLRITLKPIDDETCNVSVQKMDTKKFALPYPGFSPKNFSIVDYMETGKLK